MTWPVSFYMDCLLIERSVDGLMISYFLWLVGLFDINQIYNNSTSWVLVRCGSGTFTADVNAVQFVQDKRDTDCLHTDTKSTLWKRFLFNLKRKERFLRRKEERKEGGGGERSDEELSDWLMDWFAATDLYQTVSADWIKVSYNKVFP